MKCITVIFKTHLDIGFTALASEITRRYPQFIRNAVATADYFRAKDPSPGGFRYRWNVGSWLIDSFLAQARAEDAAFLEKAIRAGDIVWHALPFTMESEIAGLAAFRAGLERAKVLDRRFGHTTRAAKLTDVPGHTRGIIGPMTDAGVRFLHIGTNPGCGVCNLPEAFRWRDAEGRELLVVYQTDYGKMLTLPGIDEAFLVSVAGDNTGAHTPETVEKLLDSLRGDAPGATIRSGTFDDMAAALEARRDVLPVITAELGSTWVHGFASDPILTARYREGIRFAEALPPAARGPFLRELELVAEHTCGVNVKQYLKDNRHWTGEAMRRLAGKHPPSNAAARSANETDKGYAMCVRSWDEQREYIDKAARVLATSERRDFRRRLAALDALAAPASLDGARPVGPALQTAHFSFKIDTERGCIRDLRRADGTRLLSTALLFGGELFGPDDCAAYYRNYLRLQCWWTHHDFGKPGMPHRKYRLIDGFPVMTLELPESDGRRILLRSRHANVFAKAWELELHLPDSVAELRATLRVMGKDPSRATHALWCSFTPAKGQGAISFTKLGERIDPANVVKGGARTLHAIDGEISLAGGATIETLDAPLLAPDARDLLWKRRNPLPRPGAPFHFCLYNNVWGTNFPQWFGEDFACRFVLR